MEEKLLSHFYSHGPLILTVLLLGIAFYFILLKKPSLSHVTVSGIMVYPIKSCRGVRLVEAEITPRGFIHDRQFAVMNRMNEPVTLRSRPKMALIVPSFSEDGTVMRISAPDLPILEVSLVEAENKGPVMRLRLWDDSVEVYEPDPAISEWFVKAIGEQQLKFVRITDKWVRKTDPKFIENGQTGLSDEFPFLMISEKSLEDFNARYSSHPSPSSSSSSIAMEAFRPNLIISGCNAYEEDKIEGIITSDGIVLNSVKLCPRCSLPNVHPKRGVMDTSLRVSKVLKSYRTGKHLRLKSIWNEKLFFGVYLDNQSVGGGVVCEGDQLEIKW